MLGGRRTRDPTVPPVELVTWDERLPDAAPIRSTVPPSRSTETASANVVLPTMS
jgi:hypothetical protein